MNKNKIEKFAKKTTRVASAATPIFGKIKVNNQ